MTLFTKCILSPASSLDGMRISVMNRHTLADGKTSDERIAQVYFQHHLPIFAPSGRLLGDWYRRGIVWEEFVERYYAQMSSATVRPFVRRLAIMATHTDVTLLCVEETPFMCHRQLLALLCKCFVPALQIEHRW